MNQKSVNAVWSRQWEKEKKVSALSVFNHRLFVEGYPVFKKYVRAYVQTNKTPRILEVGAGTGRYGIAIARDFSQAQVVITDVLEESLSLAKKLADEMGVTNVSFECADLLALPFDDNSFDIMIADVVVQHIRDEKRTLREMYRVLKPGGRVIISNVNTWNPHSWIKWFQQWFGKEYEYGFERSRGRLSLAKALKKAGFHVVATDGFYVGYGIFRLKNRWKGFHFWGRALNRLSKIVDRFTGRFCSKTFGFEVVVVGEKRTDSS